MGNGNSDIRSKILRMNYVSARFLIKMIQYNYTGYTKKSYSEHVKSYRVNERRE